MNKKIIFMAMGFELVGLILGSVWMGQVLDNMYGGKGMWTAGLMVAVLAGWFIHMIYLLKQTESEDNESPPQP